MAQNTGATIVGGSLSRCGPGVGVRHTTWKYAPSRLKMLRDIDRSSSPKIMRNDGAWTTEAAGIAGRLI